MGAATSTTDSENTLIISSNTFWSVFNFRRGLIRALAAEGTKVIVVAPEDNYRSSVEELGCKTVSIRMSLDGLNPFQEFRTIFEYVSIFRRYSPNLCLLFTVKPNLYGSLASIVTGVPVFCTMS